MPVIQIYASTAYPQTSTWVNIGNIPGSDASEATNTSTVAVNSIVQLQLGFNTSAVPAGVTVNSILITVAGRCNANTSRAFFSIESEDAYGTTYTTNSSASDFTTTLDARFMIMNNPAAIAPYLGSTNLLFNLAFISRINSSRILYIQYAHLSVNYTEASGGKNTLFMGENF